jgi:hypothetical protein
MMNFAINWRRIGFLVGVGFLVLVIIDLNARIEGLNNLNAEMSIVAAQATQGMQTHASLETQVAYATSDKAAEDFARANREVKEGEIPVVPVGNANATPVPEVTATPSPAPLSNWQIWWNLFFGQ